MRLFVLTRSAYGPAWDRATNERRLTLTAGVTVRSLAAQQHRDWTWLVALDADDPLREQRLAAYQQAGVPVRAVPTQVGDARRAQAAMLAYQAPWNAEIGPRDDFVLTLRLDDDDALHPTTLARLWRAVTLAHVKRRVAFMFPCGYRVFGQRYSPVRHESNAMHALQTPPGDPWTVYSYLHRKVARHVPVRMVDEQAAWLWLRHPDTLSGHKTGWRPVNRALQRAFPVDWKLLATLPGGPPQPGQMRFK